MGQMLFLSTMSVKAPKEIQSNEPQRGLFIFFLNHLLCWLSDNNMQDDILNQNINKSGKNNLTKETLRFGHLVNMQHVTYFL